MRPSTVALLLAACASCAPARRAKGTLALEPCQLTAKQAPEVVNARCGSLEVWEDRTAKSGRRLAIKVAVVPATGADVAADPLFLLAGGPGQSATEVYPAIAPVLARLQARHDIVLVDQRGTGGSHRLECPDTDESDDPAAVRAAATACLKSLDADVRHYDTATAMDDLDDVRAALGYDAIDLYGVSYGTRAALVYARRHRANVRTVVVDGVVPTSFTLGATAARDAQRALDGIFGECARDAACHQAFPDLERDLREVLARVEKEPIDLTVADPTTGARTAVHVTRTKVASAIFTLSYTRETAALLPLLVHEAATSGDLSKLAAQWLFGKAQTKVADGMHLAVACSEDAPFIRPDEVKATARGTYLGESFGLNYVHACADWPRSPSVDHGPVTSDVPVLLLSGALDPVTPPPNADEAARTLGQSVRVVVPHEGHNTIVRGCVSRLVSEFIERGTTAGLDTSCAAKGHDIRFFTSLGGPPP